MDNQNSDIKNIIDKMSSGKEAPGPDGSYEFEFGEPAPKNDGGLVFEFVEEAVSSPTPPAPKREAAPVKDPEAEEFSIPDVFEVSEKYNTPATPDITSRIWTTYVPRFTEVSETYRMKNDPRPRSGEDLPHVAAVKVVESDEPTCAESVDPTAEIDGSVSEAVLVKPTPSPADENSETLNVYKFSDGDTATEEEHSEDEEAEELIRLVKGEPVAEEIEEAPAEESAPEETEVEEAAEQEEKTYSIPDPDEGEIEVIDCGAKAGALSPITAPEGVSELPAEAAKHSTEFTHRTQRDGFKDKFLDRLMSVRIRMVAAIIFAVVMLAYETLASFGVLASAIPALGLVPDAIAAVDMLFAACIFALVLPEVALSVKSLIFGRVTSDLLLIPGLVVVCAYSLTVSLSGARNYMLVGFIYATLVLSVIVGTYFRLTADFTAFKFISKNTEKRIIDKKLTRTLPEENMALDGVIDEYKSRTARIFRTGFISDFFKRIAKNEEKNSHTLLILSVSLGAAIVTAFVCFFVAGGLTPAITAFALVFLLGCPAVSVLSHKLPYYDAQSAALAEESTVVGETSFLAFSDVDVVAFEDSEIFGPDDVNLRRIMLYGDRDNMEKVMRQMCSLFSAVGGPLKYIFENALDNRVRHNPATSVTIEDDGVSGDVGGSRIAAGSEAYMRRHGIAIPEGAARPEGGIDTTKVMYAAENGEVYAKFYVRYSFSEEFTMLLPTLKEKGIIPLIYTRDPNVSNELLRTLTAGSDCMRVMKKYSLGSEDDVLYRSVSAGVVTYGDKINAINVILLAKRYKTFGEHIANMELYAMGAGIALAALLTILGFTTVPSILLGLWQCVWCVVLSIAGRNTFNNKD